MTNNEVSTRNAKASSLRVFQAGQGEFYVENSQGKICYRVNVSNGTKYCTCGDFTSNAQKDPKFVCKHILAVVNSNGQGVKAEWFNGDKPKLDERWIIEIEGREFVKYPGLLDLGHQKGILKIDVDPLQYPTKDNGQFAICKAAVVSRTGEMFTDVGDACPDNCSSKVKKHLLRMASTRAIARALRSYTNIGMTCLEELAEMEEALGDDSPRPKPKVRKENSPTAKEAPPKPKPAETKGENGKSESPQKKNPPEKGPEGPKETTEAAGAGKDQKNSSGEQPKPSTAQIRAIEKLAERRGISPEELSQKCQAMFGTVMASISAADASSFIRSLQQSA
jgi:predicted nucleic acid-binding Zn finger protein